MMLPLLLDVAHIHNNEIKRQQANKQKHTQHISFTIHHSQHFSVILHFPDMYIKLQLLTISKTYR